MIDLQKYSKKAKTDPNFREKLLQDANQAIKEKFGDELPYKVTCHEKLVFEVKPKKSFSESEFSKVAGGSDPPKQMRILKTILKKGKDGSREKVNVYAPGFQPPNQQPTSKNLSSNELNGVAGGTNQENTGAPNPPYGVPTYGPYGVPTYVNPYVHPELVPAPGSPTELVPAPGSPNRCWLPPSYLKNLKSKEK